LANQRSRSPPEEGADKKLEEVQGTMNEQEDAATQSYVFTSESSKRQLDWLKDCFFREWPVTSVKTPQKTFEKNQFSKTGSQSVFFKKVSPINNLLFSYFSSDSELSSGSRILRLVCRNSLTSELLSIWKKREKNSFLGVSRTTSARKQTFAN